MASQPIQVGRHPVRPGLKHAAVQGCSRWPPAPVPSTQLIVQAAQRRAHHRRDRRQRDDPPSDASNCRVPQAVAGSGRPKGIHLADVLVIHHPPAEMPYLLIRKGPPVQPSSPDPGYMQRPLPESPPAQTLDLLQAVRPVAATASKRLSSRVDTLPAVAAAAGRTASGAPASCCESGPPAAR